MAAHGAKLVMEGLSPLLKARALDDVAERPGREEDMLMGSAGSARSAGVAREDNGSTLRWAGEEGYGRRQEAACPYLDLQVRD